MAREPHRGTQRRRLNRSTTPRCSATRSARCARCRRSPRRRRSRAPRPAPRMAAARRGRGARANSGRAIVRRCAGSRRCAGLSPRIGAAAHACSACGAGEFAAQDELDLHRTDAQHAEAMLREFLVRRAAARPRLRAHDPRQGAARRQQGAGAEEPGRPAAAASRRTCWPSPRRRRTRAAPARCWCCWRRSADSSPFPRGIERAQRDRGG